MKRIIFFGLFLVFPLFAYSHKLTIAYTGNTYSALYPCGKCPVSVGGGVGRRATAIDEVKEDNENVLIIEAGNFTAGGAFDEVSINYELDKKRTFFYYATLSEMGYDVVGVGDAEFNFGLDFFNNNLNNWNFSFVSTNMSLKGVLPYFIKNVGDVKVGILGLTDRDILKRNSLIAKDYKKAINQAILKIKDKVDIIILLSNADDGVNEEIAREFNDIKVIISSGRSLSSKASEEILNTIIVRPSHQAKELRVIDLEFKGKEIVNYNIEHKPLSLDKKEALRIKKMIPSCISSDDCPSKEGLVSQCAMPATDQSRCIYVEAKKIKAILITDKDCLFCATRPTVDYLKTKFLGISFEEIDYRQKQAQNLIKKYGLASLPIIILPLDIEESPSFSKVLPFLDRNKDSFIVKKKLTGVFLFLDREKVDSQIDIFFNIYLSGLGDTLNTLKDFCQKKKIKLNLHLLSQKGVDGYLSMIQQEEIERVLAVKKLYPDKFWDYLIHRMQNMQSSWWPDLFRELNIDYKKIRDFVRSEEMKKVVAANEELSRDLGIIDGVIILVNNRRIFWVFNINYEDLEKIINYQ